jgi:hypothetical protein
MELNLRSWDIPRLCKEIEFLIAFGDTGEKRMLSSAFSCGVNNALQKPIKITDFDKFCNLMVQIAGLSGRRIRLAEKELWHHLKRFDWYFSPIAPSDNEDDTSRLELIPGKTYDNHQMNVCSRMLIMGLDILQLKSDNK